MSLLEKASVKQVRQALADAGHEDTIIELAETARSAEDAANAVGCQLGAIVKSLVFTIERRFVMALVAGDHSCIEDNLGRAFNLDGEVRRPKAAEVKGATGFTIGGVAPIGLKHPLPIVVDRSLKRFETIYAAAGHPHCVFATEVSRLTRMAGGFISWTIAEPTDPNAPAAGRTPPLRRSKTFLKAADDNADR